MIMASGTKTVAVAHSSALAKASNMSSSWCAKSTGMQPKMSESMRPLRALRPPKKRPL